MKHLYAASLLVLIISCNTPANIPEIQPVVAITQPPDNSLVPKLLEIKLEVLDSADVEYVELLVDNESVGVTDSTEPYSMLLNTTVYDNNSTHILSIKSHDNNNIQTISEPISITVNNSDSIYMFMKYHTCNNNPDSASFKNVSQDSSPAFPKLETLLGSSKFHYNSEDTCISAGLILTNIGLETIVISEEQAVEISNRTIGLYTNSRLFSINLRPAFEGPIQAGPFLQPGQIKILNGSFNKKRIDLYSTPPLGGGVITRELDIQGPWGFLGLSRIDITVDINFGRLHDVRTYEQGAWTEFVPGNIILIFKKDVTLNEAEKLVADNRSRILSAYCYKSMRILDISIPFNNTTLEMIEIFMQSPLIKNAERNGIGWFHSDG